MKFPSSIIMVVPFLMLVTGCTIYGGSLILRPQRLTRRAGTESRLTEDSEKLACEVLSEIAKKYEMRLVPGPYDLRFTEPYRGLLLFKGRGSERDVALGAKIHTDGSEIVFTITDQGHGDQTKFTSTIERELDQDVRRRFRGFTLTWDHSSALRNPLAP